MYFDIKIESLRSVLGFVISFLLSVLLCKDVSYGKVWRIIDILLDIHWELPFMCNPSSIYFVTIEFPTAGMQI